MLGASLHSVPVRFSVEALAGPESVASARRLLRRWHQTKGRVREWEHVGMGDQDVDRGWRHECQGELVLAEEAYRRADERGDAEGALLLGVLLKRRGDLAGAEAAYLRAEARGSAPAACNLAVLLEAQGDVAAAEAAYRRADAKDFPGGAFGLGQLLFNRGDIDGSIAANRRADDLGDAEAAFNLGVLLRQTGDLTGAEEAFMRAGRSGIAAGLSAYARLLEQRGDLAGAEEAYRQADQAGDPNGAYGLGVLLYDKGQNVDSFVAFRHAAALGHAGATEVLRALGWAAMAGDVPNNAAGYAFISYVREDSACVDRLQRILQHAGIPVWRDTSDLWPGEDWRHRIRNAIANDALAFIACFSKNSLSRARTYQNVELILAIDQLRLRQPEQPWLIPVRFDDCQIPDRDIGAGRTLSSIQRVDLFADHFDDSAARLVAAIRRILRH